MKMHGWPRPPVIIALVLGEQINQYFWLSINAFGWRMLERPQLLVIVAITLTVIVLAIRVQRSASSTIARARIDMPAPAKTASQVTPDGKDGSQ
jgi:hypothetical protein